MWYIIIIIIVSIILISTITIFLDYITDNLIKYCKSKSELYNFLWKFIFIISIFWIIALPIILIVSIIKFIQWNLKDTDRTMTDITVTIKGFKTQDAAYEFMNWYSGAGEQELDYWMDCRREEGKDIPNNFCTKNIDNETNTLTIN